MSLERAKLPFTSLSPSESWLRQQSSISPDPQKIHSNAIKILSDGHCLCRGPGACASLSLCSCRGFVPHKPPGLGTFPRPLEGCCAAGHREHRDVLEVLDVLDVLDDACHALRAVKLHCRTSLSSPAVV